MYQMYQVVCTIGQIIFIGLFILAYVCRLSDNVQEKSRQFGEKHPKLATILVVLAVNGVLKAILSIV